MRRAPRRSTPAGGRPRPARCTRRRPAARRISRSGPPTTTRPRSMIAIDSQSASTVSIWWVEKISVLPWSRSSRNASRRIATLTGSRPVNGSSISSTSGSWRIAAMSWIFCWLPFDSSSARRLGELRHPEPGQPVERLAARPVGCDAVERREVRELVEHDHPRVEAALLGEVAPRRPRQGPAVGASPGDRPAIGLEHAEHDPHRRRLAGSVRAEEPEDLAGRDVEREAVERDDGPEALVELVDREGHRRRIARTLRRRDWSDRPASSRKMPKSRQGLRRRADEADPPIRSCARPRRVSPLHMRCRCSQRPANGVAFARRVLRPETRAKRIEETVAALKAGKRQR